MASYFYDNLHSKPRVNNRRVNKEGALRRAKKWQEG